MANDQVSPCVQEADGRDGLCEFDLADELPPIVPNLDQALLIARRNQLILAVDID